MMKSVVLSGALMLCAMMVGCVAPSASPAQSSQSEDELQAPDALSTQCSQFCSQVEGPGWTSGAAGSELQCESKNGFWFPSGGEFQGPPPGCCCVCPLRPPLACA